jgi:hypothetical protein
MRNVMAAALAAAMLAAPAAAQEPLKPGPQHARIGYFVGTWAFSGEAKESPMGPGGKMTGSETCEWFAGGFQMVCRGDMTSPRGPAKNGSIWAYDQAQQAYSYYGYNSMGEAFYVTGNVAGKVWTWNADFPVEGVSMKIKATITEETPTAYAYKLETSMDGTTWLLMEEGRATKKGR